MLLKLKFVLLNIELGISSCIAFEAFLRRLKNHYPVDSAIYLSYNRPACTVSVVNNVIPRLACLGYSKYETDLSIRDHRVILIWNKKYL